MGQKRVKNKEQKIKETNEAQEENLKTNFYPLMNNSKIKACVMCKPGLLRSTQINTLNEVVAFGGRINE